MPDADVRQLRTECAGDVPDSVWADTEVLHTHAAIPDPARAPHLRLVQLDTAGVDHLSGHPIWASPVEVSTIGGVSATPMAEYVTMMTLAHHHHLPDLFRGQLRHEWQPTTERFTRYRPTPTVGATMVIVGFGRIGRQIARHARALGMAVVGVSRSGTGESEPGIELAPVDRLPRLATRADVLVLVAPLTDQTRNLISDPVLGALKPGALVIDIGRGHVLDHAALRRALETGRVGAAVLDVFPSEPLAADDPLWDDPRITITPHISGFAPDYHEEVLALVSDNLRRLSDGRPLRNLVSRVNGY